MVLCTTERLISCSSVSNTRSHVEDENGYRTKYLQDHSSFRRNWSEVKEIPVVLTVIAVCQRATKPRNPAACSLELLTVGPRFPYRRELFIPPGDGTRVVPIHILDGRLSPKGKRVSPSQLDLS